jgi:UDP-GlcNAc:undecaprenyl-phosphate/decaprenyl-phosphate GlcNAc-1-phosphate transferase
MFSIALAFLCACGVSLALVPVVKWFCDRFDLTDRPDSRRKLHRIPVALGGGVAVFLSAIGVILVLFAVRTDAEMPLHESGGRDLPGLLLAATILVGVGVLDDAIGLRGRQKLLGQFVACGALIFCGLVIERLQSFSWTVHLGLLSVPVTFLWLLAAINAINLLDGINGLATIVGIIDSLAIAVLSELGGHRSHALVAAAFGGSLVGFLRYNFPHAKMFLGDAGSMLIGLVVGALSVQSSLTGHGTVLLATPLCLLTIPFFDSTAAMLRRKLTGRSIFNGDRGHLHHRLAERFGSLRAVGILALTCCASALAALISIIWRNELVAVISGIAIVAMFVVFRLFGHSELRLLASRIELLAPSCLRLNCRSPEGDKQLAVHLQGDREWERLWTDLREAAFDLPVNNIELNVNAPMIEEDFHASWTRRTTDVETIWRFDLPLVVLGHQIGHLRMVGERSPDFPADGLEKVLCLFATFEGQLGTLFAGPEEISELALEPVVNSAVLAGSTPFSSK